tara:strand:- start:55 stop:237 length:183 start_codon:yes stop_codon:yes gene_type:complete
MTKKDLKKFLKKIEHLNEIVDLINASSEKKEALINCKNHEDVVNLTKLWGFEISKRWGED